MANSLSAYQELLGRLNRSKAKQLQRSNEGRSAPTREALRKEQETLREERRKGIKSDFVDTMPKINPPKDFLNSFLPKPGGVYKSVVTDYYNPETGDTYTSYNSGDLPPTGYVKGYKPKSDKPVSSPEEKTPTTSSKPALTKAMLNRMASF